MANFIRSLTLACNSEHHTTNNHSAIGDSSNLNHDDDSLPPSTADSRPLKIARNPCVIIKILFALMISPKLLIDEGRSFGFEDLPPTNEKVTTDIDGKEHSTIFIYINPFLIVLTMTLSD
eukprot:scaffold191_cov273-Chaetoceros_neogracile.AAC.51